MKVCYICKRAKEDYTFAENHRCCISCELKRKTLGPEIKLKTEILELKGILDSIIKKVEDVSPK